MDKKRTYAIFYNDGDKELITTSDLLLTLDRGLKPSKSYKDIIAIGSSEYKPEIKILIKAVNPIKSDNLVDCVHVVEYDAIINKNILSGRMVIELDSRLRVALDWLENEILRSLQGGD